MKYLMLLTLASLLLISRTAHAEDIRPIVLVAETLQPDLTESEATAIAHAIDSHSQAYNLDWKLLLAILFQESSLYRDPQGCLKKHLRCDDLGIGQVNWKTWAKLLKLNKVKLVTDYHYAIWASANILANYRDRFKSHDRFWFARYNSGTPEYRRTYRKKVLAHYAKIKAEVAVLYRHRDSYQGALFQAALRKGSSLRNSQESDHVPVADRRRYFLAEATSQ